MVKHSKHPLSVSLQKAIERDDAFDAMSIKELDVSETRGMGLEERGSGIRLGNRRWCAIDSKQEDDLQEIWFISSDIEKPIRITFQDELRDGAQEMVTELKALGLEVIIISGDNQGTVKKVADKLGVQKYYWNIIPTEKYEMIAALQERRKKPLMVGDGFNDSAALKLAYVSASPTSALGIAQNCADIVFEKSLLDIVTTLKIAKKLSLLVKQNFAISICYNIISIPIAVMGFAAPIVAAIAMSTSSILVVLNSMRLNWQSWRI